MQDPNETEEWFVCAQCGLPTRTYLDAAFAEATAQ
jgi:hypothetical protein